MDSILHTKEVDLALEDTSGMVLTSDTVAIWNEDEQMYGIYKNTNKLYWELAMTSFTLDNIMENK